MRSIFHKVDFILNSIFGIGYCLGTSLTLELIEYAEITQKQGQAFASWLLEYDPDTLSAIGAAILGILFWYVGFFAIGQKHQKERLDSKVTLLALAVITLGFEVIMRVVFDRSLYDDLVDNFFFTIGCALISYAFMKVINYYWVYKIVKYYGDGSEGLDMEFEASDFAEKRFAGTNKTLKPEQCDAKYAVKCTNGTFVGRKAVSKNVKEYLGIPYAQAPVGSLRWQPPVPCEASDVISEAYYYGKSALQAGEHVEFSEDCLYLNIWTHQKAKAGDKRPVIVVLHTTDGLIGTNNMTYYNGDEFVQSNPEVICVNVGYRLGVLGFMDFSQVPGGEEYKDATNLGLLDQLQAIAWLKENVAAFGGDPDNITVLGFVGSYDMAAVLPLVKKADVPKIKKVICFSGNLDNLTTRKEAQTFTEKLMQKFNLKNMEDFLNLDKGQLLQIIENSKEDINSPILDGYILPLNPLEEYASGAAKDMSIMVGTNKDEINGYVAYANKSVLQKLIKDAYQQFKAKATEADEALFGQLLAEKNEAKQDEEAGIMEICNYLLFHNPAVRLGEAITNGGGSAHLFYWKYESPLQNIGAFCGMELSFILGQAAAFRKVGIIVDDYISTIFRQMVANFMHKGDPSVKVGEVEHLGNVPWPAFSKAERPVLVFDKNSIKEADGSFIAEVDRVEPLRKYADCFAVRWSKVNK